MQSYAFKDKNTAKVTVVVFLVLGLWIAYLLWTMSLGRRTVLMSWVPEWSTYLLAGLVTGIILVAKRCFRPDGFNAQPLAELFFGGFSLGMVTAFNVYAVGVYLLPGEVITYEANYDISHPGPATGKFGHCEAGLWFRDAHTHNRIELCTNNTELFLSRKTGMDAVYVTAYTNRLGSYILDYKFIWHNGHPSKSP